MKNLLNHYCNYNVWANNKMIGFLQQVNAADLDKELISSFSSLRKTVLHIWDAELIWHARMEGRIMNWPPTAEINNPQIKDFVNASIALQAFFAKQDDSFFLQTMTYQNSAGVEFKNTYGGSIMHCINHSTFHRGQLVTLLRQVGFTKLHSTDLISYMRDENVL